MEYCSDQRSDESEDEYFQRWKDARDTWRQQYVDAYYKAKAAGLRQLASISDGQSPNDIAHVIMLIEQDIKIDAGLARPEDFERPRTPPLSISVPGRSLSEVSVPPEPFESWAATPPPLPSPPIDATADPTCAQRDPVPKRKRDEDDETPAKKRRMTQTRPSTTRGQRKRGREEEEEEVTRATRARKRTRRTDMRAQPVASPPPARATSGHKRRRRPDDDDAHDHETQASQKPGRQGPGPKRRRIVEKTSSDGRGHGTGQAAAVAAAAIMSSSSSSRVTRARRRQLSGTDTQLLQLGQHGQVDVQEERPASTRLEAGTRAKHKIDAATKGRRWAGAR
ncbi:hypothetical protein M406DRAFT_75484 [Cryphonectria parasitica EP155]|uniref:Uncharacterized protein n=1 Tax=Cryphonectria parasitica (strain ATCC 38755 / EP155) TaxID=660469 RepID=A0A9P5CR75_CRYP1|nr:uncharacterized protein M406DRAFT_75484 [Cryphonectria parasitica EP155]KAF3768259.1 hypothetical protein M406DRAFT_75484 [Cryphonectria parasitica EP155]